MKLKIITSIAIAALTVNGVLFWSLQKTRSTIVELGGRSNLEISACADFVTYLAYRDAAMEASGGVIKLYDPVFALENIKAGTMSITVVPLHDYIASQAPIEYISAYNWHKLHVISAILKKQGQVESANALLTVAISRKIILDNNIAKASVRYPQMLP